MINKSIKCFESFVWKAGGGLLESPRLRGLRAGDEAPTASAASFRARPCGAPRVDGCKFDAKAFGKRFEFDVIFERFSSQNCHHNYILLHTNTYIIYL